MADHDSGSSLIDEKISALGDWRGETLQYVRTLIHQADPAVLETVKWVKPTNPSGVPIWEHAGILCTGEVYRSYVKLTFAQGAAIDDPDGLFNAGFGGNTRRAIDIREHEAIDAASFVTLIKNAVALNVARQESKPG